MNDGSRAVIFGRDADAYDSHRPAYPPDAIDHLRGLVSAQLALEIGAGTGKATVDMARDGLTLTCLEPSIDMAEVLRAKDLPGVEVVVETFEGWDGEPRSRDLIYAAQAWHWVDHGMAYEKARSVLRPDGVLALMWNIPLTRYDVFEDVYSEYAPGLLQERDERIVKRDSPSWLADLGRAGFHETRRFTTRWSVDLDAAGYRALYSTYSDHLLLPDNTRSRLLDALEQAVVDQGGVIPLEYRTDVFSGRV